MKSNLRRLIKSQKELSEAIKSMESEIKSKVEFNDYSIFYQPSDGFVLEYETNNAPLIQCLMIINKKGFLSYKDYLRETI